MSTWFQIRKVITHKFFNSRTFDSDIALLKLWKQPIIAPPTSGSLNASSTHTINRQLSQIFEADESENSITQVVDQEGISTSIPSSAIPKNNFDNVIHSHECICKVFDIQPHLNRLLNKMNILKNSTFRHSTTCCRNRINGLRNTLRQMITRILYPETHRKTPEIRWHKPSLSDANDPSNQLYISQDREEKQFTFSDSSINNQLAYEDISEAPLAYVPPSLVSPSHHLHPISATNKSPVLLDPRDMTENAQTPVNYDTRSNFDENNSKEYLFNLDRNFMRKDDEEEDMSVQDNQKYFLNSKACLPNPRFFLSDSMLDESKPSINNDNNWNLVSNLIHKMKYSPFLANDPASNIYEQPRNFPMRFRQLRCVVLGWGRTTSSMRSGSNTLQFAEV